MLRYHCPGCQCHKTVQAGKADVRKLTLPKPRFFNKAHMQEMEEHFRNLNLTEWPPIIVRRDVVIDGFYRVLVARKYEIDFIPCLKVVNG